jgi:hypothetical protein
MDTALSRSGRSDAGGKLTARLDVPVSAELEEAVIALAAVAGVPKAEYARMLMERAVFGDMSLLRRLARPIGMGPWDESRSNNGGQP